MRLDFFDCNCLVGKRADRKPGEPWSLNALLNEMERCGIADALVCHAASRDYDPAAGNSELAALIAGQPHLHGCWALLPPGSGEFPPPDRFVDDLLAAGMAAAVAYPALHTYSMDDWSMGALFERLARRRIPLLLPFGQCPWETVNRLCRGFTDLPVIVTGLNYRQLRFLLPLWETVRNLYVDLSWFSLHQGLEFLSSKGLTTQVLFGTNWPSYEPGAAVTMVTYADLPEEERRGVAAGNLQQILNGVRRD